LVLDDRYGQLRFGEVTNTVVDGMLPTGIVTLRLELDNIEVVPMLDVDLALKHPQFAFLLDPLLLILLYRLTPTK
jgi:hypothetical protein